MQIISRPSIYLGARLKNLCSRSRNLIYDGKWKIPRERERENVRKNSMYNTRNKYVL